MKAVLGKVTIYWLVRVVSIVAVLLLVPNQSFLAMSTSALSDAIPVRLKLASPITQSNDLSNRYIIFLDGINSFSSTSKPLNGDFEKIQSALIALGIKLDHFIYFSYSGVHESKIISPVSFFYCAGWGIDNCPKNLEPPKDPTVSPNPDLINLSASPVYADTDTHQSIVKQADVLDWLIRQIIRDKSAKIDLIGFSLGGVVASYWASGIDSKHPLSGYIHSIVLIDSPVGGISYAVPILENSCPQNPVCKILSQILVYGADPIWPGFGWAILQELQPPPTPNSIVTLLPKAAQNFPVTIIQSKTDYLVNKTELPICLDIIPIQKVHLPCLAEGKAFIGQGGQGWARSPNWPNYILHEESGLGGQIPTRPLYAWEVAGRLLENHSAVLAAPKTFTWVVEAVKSENTSPVGTDAVWEGSSEAIDQKVQACVGNTQNNCILTVMHETGASPQAIAVAEQIGNDGFLADFKEMGRVDLGTVTYPLAANGNFGNPILLNGTPLILLVNAQIAEDEASRNLDLRSNSTYSSLANQFPNVTSDPNTSFETMQQLPSGGQRFIFTDRLLNGCHGCEQVGIAHIALDFDATGKFLGTKFVSIEVSSASTPSKQETNPAASQPQQVCYATTCFSYDASLATTVSGTTIPEQQSKDAPFWEQLPAYTKFQFEGYPTSSRLTPELKIFPVKELLAKLGSDDPNIEMLKTLLSSRSAEAAHVTLGGNDPLPFLPLQNAGMVFVSNIQYIDFGSGSGIRYITAFSQASPLVDLQGLLYTFQGLTQDNSYYVSVSFPVAVTISPGTPPNISASSANDSQIAAYNQKLVEQLDQLESAQYNPNLDFLDALIKSLKIDTSSSTSLPDASVNTATLNVRSGPSTNYSRVDTVQQADALQVTGRDQDCAWLQVITPTGTQGWVAAQFVTLNKSCNLIPEASVATTQSTTPDSPTKDLSSRNIAPEGTVEASSHHDVPCYLPENAIDGILIERPAPECGSWATRGELAGAWLKITFNHTRLITSVILYDRTNPTDQVLAGRLEFSDGSQIPVGTLPNDGAPVPFAFPEKAVTWVKFVVEDAQGLNIGLTEIEIYGQ